MSAPARYELELPEDAAAILETEALRRRVSPQGLLLLLALVAIRGLKG